MKFFVLALLISTSAFATEYVDIYIQRAQNKKLNSQTLQIVNSTLTQMLDDDLIEKVSIDNDTQTHLLRVCIKTASQENTNKAEDLFKSEFAQFDSETVYLMSEAHSCQ